MSRAKRLLNGLPLAIFSCFAFLSLGCSAQHPRVTVVTGTTVGLKVSPGDGSTQPPQVTFAYKRAEFAMIPTKGDKAMKADKTPGSSSGNSDSDAFSTLAAFHFSTEWIGKTEVDSFIATGHAACDIQDETSAFNKAFAQATLGGDSKDIQNRRLRLQALWDSLTDDEAQKVLDLAQVSAKPESKPKESLRDAIKAAQTTSQLMALESAFLRASEEEG